VKLKTTTFCYQKVDYRDLELFVQEVYGREWDFIAAQECGNDSDHTFNPTGTHFDLEKAQAGAKGRGAYVPGLDRGDAARIAGWLAGDSFPSAHTILDDLVVRGLIQPGNYLVSVSW
jgi:hypothetical protein